MEMETNEPQTIRDASTRQLLDRLSDIRDEEGNIETELSFRKSYEQKLSSLDQVEEIENALFIDS